MILFYGTLPKKKQAAGPFGVDESKDIPTVAGFTPRINPSPIPGVVEIHRQTFHRSPQCPTHAAAGSSAVAQALATEGGDQQLGTCFEGISMDLLGFNGDFMVIYGDLMVFLGFLGIYWDLMVILW